MSGSGFETATAVSEVGDRGPLFASFPGSARDGSREYCQPDSGGASGPALCFLWVPETGEVDRHELSGVAGPGRYWGWGHDRLPGGTPGPRAQMDAAHRNGVDVSPGAGT